VLSLNESIFEMLKKTEIFMKNHDKSQKSMVEAREKALAIAEKYELEAAKNTSLFPGAVETLKALKEMKLKMGLCTVNGQRSTDYVLKRFKIEDYFDAFVPRDKVKYVKPNSEHLEAVLKALKVKADEAIVVGDSTIDMKCARELKVTAVGLPTGVSSPKDLISSGASYFITSLADLPSLIEYVGRTPEKQ
jgi:phosphoglycolate phosphatase